MKLSDLKKKIKNQWVLGEVTKEDKQNRILEIKPIAHSKDRQVVYQALASVRGKKHVATLYTGKLPPKGTAYAFHASIAV